MSAIAPTRAPRTRRSARRRAGDRRPGPLEQPLHEGIARRILKLVHGKRRKDRRRRPGQGEGRDVSLDRAGRQSEVAIGSRGFSERPRMAVDADDARWVGEGAGPGGACGARAAPEIHENRVPPRLKRARAAHERPRGREESAAARKTAQRPRACPRRRARHAHQDAPAAPRRSMTTRGALRIPAGT